MCVFHSKYFGLRWPTVLSCLVIYFTDADAVSRAFNLGLAAILGKGVYNFGELVSIIIAVNVYF